MHIEKAKGSAFCSEPIPPNEARLTPPVVGFPTDEVCLTCATEMGKEGRRDTMERARQAALLAK